MTLGITGLHKVLGRDYGIEEPYGDPQQWPFLKAFFRLSIK